MFQMASGSPDPGQAPSSAQGGCGGVIQPNTQHKRSSDRQGKHSWMATWVPGHRELLRTEREVLLIHRARFSFLNGLDFHFPNKMFAGASSG